MIKCLYVVKDKVAEESGPVFEAVNNGVALRHYQNMLRESSTPNDYLLLKVGCINHATNIVTACKPELIMAKVSDVEKGSVDE